MKRLHIQVYEIQTPSEAEWCIDLGVDHVGSVLLSETDWKVPEIKNCIRLTQQRSAKSSLIPLFNTPGTVFDALDYYEPDIVHFCETLAAPDDASGYNEALLNLQVAVKENFPAVKIMRSIPIQEAGTASGVPTLALAKLFEPQSDLFLTDTLLTSKGKKHSDQPVSGFVGITGKTCDWDIAGQLVKQSRIPVILAGGIDPDNVFEGITTVLSEGVDSCTGTNARDHKGRPIRFKKDPEKVSRLVDETRRAEKVLSSR